MSRGRGRGWSRQCLPILVASLLLASAGTALAASESEVTSEQIVTLRGATSAQVEIDLDFGQIRVSGGSLAGAGMPILGGELLRAEFMDGSSHAAPTIDYEVADEVGHLVVSPSRSSSQVWPWEDQKTGCALYLNPSVPTDLNVSLAAGQATLALGGLSLTDLEVEVGAGDVALDFAGDWRSDLSATIALGAGDLKLRLPRDVGVKIDLEQGLGDVTTDGGSFEDNVFVSDGFAEASVQLDLAIELGAGDVEIDFVG